MNSSFDGVGVFLDDHTRDPPPQVVVVPGDGSGARAGACMHSDDAPTPDAAEHHQANAAGKETILLAGWLSVRGERVTAATGATMAGRRKGSVRGDCAAVRGIRVRRL